MKVIRLLQLPWAGRFLFIAVTLALFIGWEVNYDIWPIRLAAQVESAERIQGDTIVGDEGVLYAKEQTDPGWQHVTMALRGWDGRELWHVSFPDLPERNVLRQIKASANARYLVEYKEQEQITLTTWLDGKRLGQVELPKPERSNLQLLQVNDRGQVLLIHEIIGENNDDALSLQLIQQQRVVATGELRMHGEFYNMQLIPIAGGQAFFYQTDVEAPEPNFHCCTFDVVKDKIVVKERYALRTMLASDSGVLHDDNDRIFTVKGPVTPDNGSEEKNPGDACVLEQIAVCSATGEISLLPPTVLNPLNGQRWTVPFHGMIGSAHVTPDGRFAVIIGQREPSTVMNRLRERLPFLFVRRPDEEAKVEMLVYERPGRLRARVTCKGKSPALSNPPEPFLVSPDGHWIVFPGYTWRAYHW